LRRVSVRGVAAITAAAVLCAAAMGCGKKKEDKPISAPPARGSASIDQLSTGLGIARGIDATLAPTSTEWRRVLVIDDKQAVLAGDAAGEAIALITTDAGKTWRSLRTERDAWSSWAFGADGTTVLVTGAREQPKVKTQAPQALLEATRLYFAPLDAAVFGSPSPLFTPPPPPSPPPPRAPRPPPPPRVGIEAIPAVLSPDMTAFVVEEGPRQFSVRHVGKPGVEPPPPLKLPQTERFIPTPWGRPPMLLSIKGRDLMMRPVPLPEKPLDPPQKIPNIVATPALPAELSAPPGCEVESWSFQKIAQPPAKTLLFGVSGPRVVTFALPATTSKTTRIGCGSSKVMVEVTDPATNGPSLALCDLEGACVLPAKAPFRPWPEKHEDTITTTPTAQGAAAVMSSRAGDRWGLYFAQSLEGGAVYEVPRVIGEGSSTRGIMDLGALLSFGKRILILLAADVTGTSRRGWYVIVSDDGGLTWNPP
jgi:hypothetical protein